MKIMTIVGTRPELIKMSRVINEFNKYSNHILVHTGQNYDYELNQVFFEELNIKKPDYFLEVAETTTAKTIAKIIEKSDEIFSIENPDALLLYGDTNSCLAVIPAKRRKIPIFHMEAGNRCLNQNVPEELNRKILDHLSDINLVLTEHARNFLIAEGIKKELIIKTGSHMEEVLNFYMPKIQDSKILNKLKILEKNFFLISFHREENVDDHTRLKSFLLLLNGLADHFKIPVLVSTHPRTRKKFEEINYDLSGNNLVQFLKPFGFFDYVKLQVSAKCILSDSGTIFEESSLLNIPAITLRAEHERHEGMDEGLLIMSSLNIDDVIRNIEVTLSQHYSDENKLKFVNDYKGGDVSKKILRIVFSYIDYINKNIWGK